MKKVLLWILTLILSISMLMSLSLVGCKTSNTTAAETTAGETTATAAETTAGETTAEVASGKETIIRMWTFLNPENDSPREKALKEIITNFEKQNPNTKIKVETQIWDQLGSKFFAAHQAGNAPDVCWIYLVGDLGQGVKLGALENLYNLFLKEWTDKDKEDFYGNNFWTYGTGDKQEEKYQFTLSRGATLLYYRIDLLKEAGINVPIQTWDEFIEATKKLTKDLDGDGKTDVWGFDGAYSLEKPGYDASVFVTALMDKQGKMINEDGKALWATEAGVNAMKLQTDLVTNYKVVSPGSVTYTIEDNYERFKAGKTAMAALGSVRYSSLLTSATFDPNNIGVMPWPSWQAGKQGPLDTIGWSVGVWSGSQNKEIAGKFLEYMVSPEADLLWSQVGGQIPVRSSTLEILTKEKDPNLYVTSMVIDSWKQNAWVWPWEANMTGVMSDFRKATFQIIMDGKDIQQALLDSEEVFNKRQ